MSKVSELRSATFELGWIPPSELRGNSRAHWAVKQRLVREMRDDGYAYSLWEEIARWNLEKASIKFTVHHWKLVDEDNLLIGFKPLLDGMVDALVFKDDSPDHLEIAVAFVKTAHKGETKTVVEIQEL